MGRRAAEPDILQHLAQGLGSPPRDPLRLERDFLVVGVPDAQGHIGARVERRRGGLAGDGGPLVRGRGVVGWGGSGVGRGWRPVGVGGE